MKIKNIFIITLTLIMCLTGCAKQKISSKESKDLSAVGETVTEQLSIESDESTTVTKMETTASAESDNSTKSVSETRMPTEKTANLTKPHTQTKGKTNSDSSAPSKESVTQKPKPVEPTKPTTAPTQTAQPETPPSVTEKPTEPPVQKFDIDYWINYAKRYAQNVGLQLDNMATDCWDNPIPANTQCKYLERDIQNRLNRYAMDDDITSVWIWAEKIADNSYEIYIGYA